MNGESPKALPGTRPLVVGAARSGMAAAKLLRRRGFDVRVCDRRASENAIAEALEALGIQCRFGSDSPEELEGRDFVVWSPGIALDHPIAVAARSARLPILSELEVGYRAAQAPLLCITGTNGKSTTADLTGALLRSAGHEVEVCGNIGRAICEVADLVAPTGLLVVEVSSFQLESVERLKPHVATWLNLTPDHLDRHGDMETYAALKQRLFTRQDEQDFAVWNADDETVTAHRTGRAVPIEFSLEREIQAGASVEGGHLQLKWRGTTERLMPVDELRLRGVHNLSNALAALATTLPYGPAPEALRDCLREYRGLEHRLEKVAVVGGVEFVNDSKATNLDSLTVALRSFREPVVLIAGGRDKGQDFTAATELVLGRVRHAVLIGEGAERIATAWKGVPVTRALTLSEAVDRAYALAHGSPDGRGTVLLSPGCASYDMFRDFEDRGRHFKAEVDRLRHKEARL